MKTHCLKIHKSMVDALDGGLKKAEFRHNDRDFKVHDQLELRGVDDNGDPCCDGWRGRYIVTHVVYGPSFEIPDGYCMMSIAKPLHWIENTD